MSENRSDYVRSYKDLDVFQKAYRISLEIHRISFSLPKTEQYGGLADQMRRASKSICANIVEGFAKKRQSVPEFRRYLTIALGSSDEMQLWLEYCRDLGYMPQDQVAPLQSEYSVISRMIFGLNRSWTGKTAA